MLTIKQAAYEYAIDNSFIGKETIIYNAFIAGTEFANRWIPIEEELPEENIPVLVKMDYCFAFTDIIATDVCYLRLHRWINALRNQHSNSNVIAWRPIEYK